MSEGNMEVRKGVCFALFAYEVGLAIRLDEAERRITAMTQRLRLGRTRRGPRYFEYRPAPLRVTFEADSLAIGEFRSGASVDVVLYDFGAVSVTYHLPLEGPFSRLLVGSNTRQNPATAARTARRSFP